MKKLIAPIDTTRLILSALVMVSLLLTSSCNARANGKFLFTVQRNYSPRPAQERVSIVLDWNDAVKQFPFLSNYAWSVTEMNFGKTVAAQVVDINNDNKPDKIVLDFTFTSNEPIYTFAFEPSKNKLKVTTASVSEDKRLQVLFLKPSSVAKGKVKSWPDEIIASTMKFYPEPTMITLYAPGQWNYEYGFYLNAMFVQWQRTKKDEYYQYIKKWADRFIDAQGRMDTTQYNVKEYKLDDILPGRLFISLYDVTKEEKYKRAATQLRDHLSKQPKTSDGGYWHKQIYPYQMWLDGIYMGDIFSAQFATTFNDPALLDEAIHQIKLIAKHTTDPVTGLMYHGWDESKNNVWAHPEKGTSPEFWGRAIGWYIMAVAECLEYVPENHPERKDVITIFQKLSQSIVKYQDKKNNLWYQVIDKGDKPGNWIETSCSAMFAYALAKGHRKGWLDQSYYDKAKKAFDTLINDYVYFDDEGKLYFTQTVKVGTLNIKTSKGDFDYYVTTERRINDYKGLAALLYASLEIK